MNVSEARAKVKRVSTSRKRLVGKDNNDQRKGGNGGRASDGVCPIIVVACVSFSLIATLNNSTATKPGSADHKITSIRSNPDQASTAAAVRLPATAPPLSSAR